MGNPFDGDETSTGTAVATAEPAVEASEIDVETTEPDADLDVDAPSAAEDGPEDTAEAGAAAPPAANGKTKAKSTKKPVAEGYIAPVAVAKKLSEHLTAKGRANGTLAADEEIVIAPQIVYATLNNNGEKSKFPIKQYTDPAITGGLKSVVREDEFLAWWDAKDERVKNRGSKVQKTKTEDAPAAAEEPTTPPVEAE